MFCLSCGKIQNTESASHTKECEAKKIIYFSVGESNPVVNITKINLYAENLKLSNVTENLKAKTIRQGHQISNLKMQLKTVTTDIKLLKQESKAHTATLNSLKEKVETLCKPIVSDPNEREYLPPPKKKQKIEHIKDNTVVVDEIKCEKPESEDHKFIYGLITWLLQEYKGNDENATDFRNIIKSMIKNYNARKKTNKQEGVDTKRADFHLALFKSIQLYTNSEKHKQFKNETLIKVGKMNVKIFSTMIIESINVIEPFNINRPLREKVKLAYKRVDGVDIYCLVKSE